MSYCSNCGNRLGDNDKFCPQCGAPVGQQDDSRRRSHFDGELHKCPKCGETLNSFVTNCPSCGYEIRGSKGISVVKELADRINQVNTLEEKNELISNFYIPNTKEDIIDFFYFGYFQYRRWQSLPRSMVFQIRSSLSESPTIARKFTRI